GKAIVHKNGAPIFIPRPSYIGLELPTSTQPHHHHRSSARNKIVDEVSVEGSKSLSVSDSSMVAEKDLGLGTSAEECSESSWKAGEKNEPDSKIGGAGGGVASGAAAVVKRQPQGGAGGRKASVPEDWAN